MQRRDFVALAGAVPLHGQSRTRIGFLGASHSHAAAKVQIVKTSPEWDLAGVWEPDSALAARYEKNGVPAASRERLLEDPSVSVIAVESDVKTHGELARVALEAGKHVHVEKPPADNMADMKRLVDLAWRGKRLMQVGYMWRHHPGFNALIQAAREGWLGEIYLVRGTMNTLIDAERRKEWALFHGGQMFEQGGHLIDPLVRLLGKPRKITHFLRHDGQFSDGLLDNTHAVFEYERAMGHITSSVLQPGATSHRSFEVLGTNGTAVLRPIEGPPRLEIDLAKAAGPYKAGKNPVTLAPYKRYEGDLAELARAVRENRPLSVSLDEDLNVQEALLRASEMWS
jgi:predicted dehydrogenase